MLAAIDAHGLSAMHAVCGWMRNEVVWQAWLPTERLSCDDGHYALNEMSCAPCPTGSASIGGVGASCVLCSLGAMASLCILFNHACCRPRVSIVLLPMVSMRRGAVCVHYFASESGQFSCINCNRVGDFYQERSGQRKCDAAL
jgi:hypothetical protein